MDEVDHINADAQFRQLTRELDALAIFSPRRKQLPTVIFVGKYSATIVNAYQRRLCPPPNKRLVPHAQVADQELARIGNDDIELFDLIGARLRGTMPNGMHRPSLDNLQLVLDVLKTQVNGPSTQDKIDALSDQLYERHRKHRRDQEEARHLAHDGAKALINASPVGNFSSVVDVADRAFRARFLSPYHFGLNHSSKYQWFIDEIGKPNNSFLGAALDLVQGGSRRGDAQLISRLLMIALLKDLAKATRPRPFKPYHYRHTTPFVVLLEKVGAGDEAAKRFIDAFLYAAPQVSCNALWLLVAADHAPQLPGITHNVAHTVQSAATSLATLRGQKDESVQAVVVAAPKEEAHFGEFIQGQPAVRPKKRPVGGLGPILIVILLVAAGSLSLGMWLKSSSACKIVGKERVGINIEGECSLLSYKNISEDDRKVEKEIVAANIEARRAVKDDPTKHIVTVVAFLPLTSSEGKVIEGNLNQLRAIAQAQKERNKSGDDRLVKVTIANAGHELSQATWVAGLICKQVSDTCTDLVKKNRVPKDPTIAGVIGIAESRSPGTFEALQSFTDSRLPVIGSSVTAGTILDDTYRGNGKDDNYLYSTTYHITPSNPRQALIAARFALQRVHAGNAIIISPEGDEYGMDIAQSFEESFVAKDPMLHKVIGHYGIEKDGSPQPSESLREYAKSFSMEKKQDIMAKVCSGKHFDSSSANTADFDPREDIIYFAGRSEDFEDITNNLAACGAEKLTIIGGSDLTRFEKSRPTVDLYYASFSALADKEIAAYGITQPEGEVVTSNQLRDFQQQYQVNYGEPKDFSNPARSYDAFDSLWRLITQVDADASPMYQAVLEKLKSSNHAILFPGATGYIDMGKGTHISPSRPIFIVKKPASTGNGKREVDLVCGRFNSNGREGNVAVIGWRWGSNTFSCP